jgi:hypothetical protein
MSAPMLIAVGNPKILFYCLEIGIFNILHYFVCFEFEHTTSIHHHRKSTADNCKIHIALCSPVIFGKIIIAQRKFQPYFRVISWNSGRGGKLNPPHALLGLIDGLHVVTIIVARCAKLFQLFAVD